MIRIHVTRVEDTGAETELGELRLAELGAVASYRETADGAGVMPDVRAALQALAAPSTERVLRTLRTPKPVRMAPPIRSGRYAGDRSYRCAASLTEPGVIETHTGWRAGRP